MSTEQSWRKACRKRLRIRPGPASTEAAYSTKTCIDRGMLLNIAIELCRGQKTPLVGACVVALSDMGSIHFLRQCISYVHNNFLCNTYQTPMILLLFK